MQKTIKGSHIFFYNYTSMSKMSTLISSISCRMESMNNQLKNSQVFE